MLLSALMFAISGPGLSLPWLFTGYVLAGTGLGAANAALTNTGISGMPRSQAGLAAAVISTMRQVGLALGVAIIGSLIATYSSGLFAVPDFAASWRICWWVVVGCGVIVLATALATTGAWGRRTAERATGLVGTDRA